MTSGTDRKVAWIFPGQGSQKLGMGMDLLDQEPAAGAVFERAADVLGWDVATLCREGSARDLKETRRAQPAILTACLASEAVLRAKELAPDAAAGHSLGEYAALVSAGVLDAGEALRLVGDRARIMGRAALECPGAMSAVLGLAADAVKDTVAELAADGPIVVANYNAPGQVVISGQTELVARAEEALERAGAGRTVRLEVSGAFHSPLMEEAEEEFAMILAGVEFAPAVIPVVSNSTGRSSQDSEELKASLLRQMAGPVLWEQSVAELVRLGVDAMVEAGPGRVLAGLVRRIAPELKVLSGEDTSSINETVSLLGGSHES